MVYNIAFIIIGVVLIYFAIDNILAGKKLSKDLKQVISQDQNSGEENVK